MQMNANHYLRSAINKKANTKSDSRFIIDVANKDGQRIGTLVCLDSGLSKNEIIVADLTAWRQRYMKYFLTQFNATPERTRLWLENIILPDPTRLLFLICLPDGDVIGNFGVCNLGEDAGELDNLIRGRKGGDPNLVYYCELALLSWMFGKLNYKTATLHVFSNNHVTIKLHSSVGFSTAKALPLSHRESNDMTEYFVAQQNGGDMDFTYLEMRIDKQRFLELHPWTRETYPEFFGVSEDVEQNRQ